MVPRIVAVENLGEALLVTGEVEGKGVAATINSPELLDNPDTGLCLILRRLASQPAVKEAKAEKMEISVEAVAYTPDPARVAKVREMETKLIKEVKS